MLSALLPLFVASLPVPYCGTQVEKLEAKHWPSQYAVTGTKSEPLYVSRVRLVRDHDRFSLSGGAPAGDAPWHMAVSVDSSGAVIGSNAAGVPLVCDARLAARCELPLEGFLASAAVLAAQRRGAALPIVAVRDFAGRCVACVDGAALRFAPSDDTPVLDPCLDRATGAVLAFRHRLSGRFEGATLDPESVSVEVRARERHGDTRAHAP